MSQREAQQGAAPDRRQFGRFCGVSARLKVGRGWAAAGELGRCAAARGLVARRKVGKLERMMSIQEFNEAAFSYQRRTLVVVGVVVLLLIPYLALVMTFVSNIRNFFLAHFGGNIAEALIGTVPFGPAVIALFAGLWFNDRRAKRDARLYCPYCTKELASSRSLVVATRNCPHCGKRVLKEPA